METENKKKQTAGIRLRRMGDIPLFAPSTLSNQSVDVFD